ncbi:MAG: hypothetical protein QG673_2116 [Pseudomonadota bacterium]|nr:hypothetical protein [Pseudomonadota bacterium]
MFISILSELLENYDKYGIHRLNGLKVVYVLLILFTVNLVYTIPNPYFYYFYIPITAMGAEVAGETVKAKYWLLFCALIGSITAVFLFHITYSYRLFFLFCAFFLALFLYLGALRIKNQMLVIIPIILSLAIYSLLYGSINTNFYAIINNGITTFIAMIIILAALILFPQSLYFRVWLRAYLLLLKQILGNFLLIQENKEVEIEPVQGHLIQLVRFANMLPRKLPIFTILKLNLLINKLRVISCAADQKIIKLTPEMLQYLIYHLQKLIVCVENEQPYWTSDAGLSEEKYLQNNMLLSKIVATWNNLCLRI